MTTEHQASRTLVKSPPELWAECSDASSLARHIGEFGEIRITRLEPESAVQWEGELATGTVKIEPAGWGTRVTLTVRTAGAGGDEALGGEPTEEASGPEQIVEETAAEQPAIETLPDPAQEEADEKVEETSAESDLAVEADPAALGGRWKTLIARTRGWFKPRASELEQPVELGAVDEASIPPPDASSAPPEPIPSPELAPADPQVAEPTPPDRAYPDVILAAALDSLGQAHHRPFSRA